MVLNAAKFLPTLTQRLRFEDGLNTLYVLNKKSHLITRKFWLKILLILNITLDTMSYYVVIAYY